MKKPFYKIMLAASVMLSFNVSAQIISTVAGNNALSAGFTGDGGAATAATLAYPGASVVDAAGNIYIADKDNHCVRKVNTSGVISTFAGTGGAFGLYGDGGAANAANLNAPLSVCLDAAGNLYIADFGNHRVRKVNTSGIISTVAGSSVGLGGDGSAATAAFLNYPTDVSMDASGNLYICDYGNQRIRKVNTSGIISTFAGSTGGYSGDGAAATAAKLSSPNGVFAAPSGQVYIADMGNNCIRKVDIAGVITTIAGNTSSGYTGDGGAATAANMNSPSFVTTDVAGNVFFSDMNNAVIRKVNTAGIITTVAGTGVFGYGGDGGAATAALFNYPTGVTFDPAGNLFVTTQESHVVRKITADVVTLSGTTTVCVGQTTTLTCSTPDGAWTSSAPATATVSSSGVVTGVAAGTVNIDYKQGLYNGTTLVTVNVCPSLDVNKQVSANAALSIYPNPSKGLFAVSLPQSGNAAILTIVDVLGKTVATRNIDKTQTLVTFSDNDLAPGNYVIKVASGDKVYREKVVIMK